MLVACRAAARGRGGAARGFEAAMRAKKFRWLVQRRAAKSSGYVVWRLCRPAPAAALPGTQSAPARPLGGHVGGGLLLDMTEECDGTEPPLADVGAPHLPRAGQSLARPPMRRTEILLKCQ